MKTDDLNFYDENEARILLANILRAFPSLAHASTTADDDDTFGLADELSAYEDAEAAMAATVSMGIGQSNGPIDMPGNSGMVGDDGLTARFAFRLGQVVRMRGLGTLGKVVQRVDSCGEQIYGIARANLTFEPQLSAKALEPVTPGEALFAGFSASDA